ncbi:E3 ubiquitin-protein ligase TRIM39-like [Leucoraja erinacea]|uniref:E3 ubiquitin-protein ligase TRIM39-like n=1 Tax=Leucoraja erinaceus TaxID=7782 RepID=UPI002454D9A9|nr:E3 ubiquitin-protein ligase TRIM39-like [Leucoraja erinacea]
MKSHDLPSLFIKFHPLSYDVILMNIPCAFPHRSTSLRQYPLFSLHDIGDKSWEMGIIRGLWKFGEIPAVGMRTVHLSQLRFVFYFFQEEAGRKHRVRDEAKPLSVVDEALPIEKFHCPASFNTAFKKISDDLKSYLALQFGEVKVHSHKMEKAVRKRRVRDKAKPLLVVDDALPIEKFHCPVSFNKEISDDFKQVSVTLDVETAHPLLEVSEDRERVRCTRTWRCLPDTGKRFADWECVLGSEGFTSGRHYWEVQVAGSRGWRLGVAAESVERKRLVTLTPETGVWSIGRRQGDVFDALTSPPSPLPARPIPGRLGVYLSYESGTVSFYDADTKSHLYTFTGNKFTEKLYPFFETWDENWLRICSGSAPGVKNVNVGRVK